MTSLRRAPILAWFARFGLVAVVLGLLLSMNVTPASAKPIMSTASATAHGTYASFNVTTSSPTSMTVGITAKPNVAGQSAPPPVIASAGTGGSKVTSWSPNVYGLNPGTQYWYTLSASDASGTSSSTGTFLTLKRQILVVFTTINVIDDSDFITAGDLTFYFKFNGAWDPKLHYGEVTASSGSTLYPFLSKTLANAPAKLDLAVQGVDDDCDAFDGLCTGGLGPGGPDYGSTSEADWATAYSSTFTIKKAAANVSENYVQTFSVLTKGHAIEFGAQGWFQVSYS